MEMVQWIFSSFNGQRDLNEVTTIDIPPTPPNTPLNSKNRTAVDSLDGLVGDLGLSEENRAELFTPRGASTLNSATNTPSATHKEQDETQAVKEAIATEAAVPTEAPTTETSDAKATTEGQEVEAASVTPDDKQSSETKDPNATEGVVQADGESEPEDDVKGKTMGAYGKTDTPRATAGATSASAGDKFVNSQGVTFSRQGDFEGLAFKGISKIIPENQRPFSSLGLVKLLSFFSGLVNDARKTESMKTLGLMLINTVIETQGQTITKNARLYEFVKDDLFKTLLQVIICFLFMNIIWIMKLFKFGHSPS